MKTLALLFFTGFLALSALPLAAQQDWGPANTSELYYINVPIEKVYSYRKGYVVVYRKGLNSLGRAYIPFEWFRPAVAKAELIQIGDGKTWPCMSIFYKEGAFYAVRLYISRRSSHQSWGSIPSTVNLDEYFEGVEAIDIGLNEQ
ncbi:MAG: hypothetical protein LBE02_02525 [Spirochaetaceae bacterium]|jgi:hypothetical protein|nr:hypothetical protein [Spirochaetaceae bacterium]